MRGLLAEGRIGRGRIGPVKPAAEWTIRPLRGDNCHPARAYCPGRYPRYHARDKVQMVDRDILLARLTSQGVVGYAQSWVS
jgi:hypothetical protein